MVFFSGYISRSVAGSYDNEGIAIFCMLLTYALWIKSVKTGSLFWSTMCALAYFYIVSHLIKLVRQWVVERRSVPRPQSEAEFFEQAL